MDDSVDVDVVVVDESEIGVGVVDDEAVDRVSFNGVTIVAFDGEVRVALKLLVFVPFSAPGVSIGSEKFAPGCGTEG